MNADQIMETVAKEFNISVEALKSDCRTRPLPIARQFAFLFLRNNHTSVQIGQLMNRTHSNVLLGVYVIQGLIGTYPAYRKKYYTLIRLTGITPFFVMKANREQLTGLFTLLDYFIGSYKPKNDVEDVLLLHLNDIFEKVRKRLHNDKKNLALNEKEAKAFRHWESLLHLLPMDEFRYEVNVCRIMVEQINKTYGQRENTGSVGR